MLIISMGLEEYRTRRNSRANCGQREGRGAGKGEVFTSVAMPWKMGESHDY
jgi:hypothetical protein